MNHVHGCYECLICEICGHEIDWRVHEHVGKYAICISCYDRHHHDLIRAQERYIESVRIDK